MCRYALEREALWRSGIEVKYVSMSSGWCSTEVVGTLWCECLKSRGWDNFYKFLCALRWGMGILFGFGMTYGAGIVR